MKSQVCSFLFFYACLLGLLLVTLTVNGQQESDSTDYYYKMVVSPKSHDSLFAGYVFYRNQKKKHLQDQNAKKAVYDLRMMIMAQIDLGLIPEAESSVIEALQIIDDQQVTDDTFDEPKLGLYNSLGMVYSLMKEYEKAIDMHNKALELCIKTGDSTSVLIMHNNIGWIYKDLEDFEKAEQHLNIVYNTRLQQEDILETAKAMDNLGAIQGKLGKESGLEKMLEALRIRIAEKDVQHYYTSYRHLTEYYKDRGHLEAARKYARLGYEAASQYTQSYLEDALPRLLELSDNPLISEYIHLSDSLTRARFLTDKKYSSAKYNLAKEQQRTLESQLQKETQEKLKLIYLLLGLTVLIIAIFVIMMLTFRHKKEKFQQIYITEKRISKKIHDEVANDLYHVMTKLQSTTDNNEPILDDLENIYTRTRDISKENSPINVNDNFNELINDLLLSYQTDAVNIITRNGLKIDWKTISEIKRATVYRVLQELMTNMRKHSRATIVVLTFNQTQSDILIAYKDNGMGCELQKSNGLHNVENRIDAINASITFESRPDHGFKVNMII